MGQTAESLIAFRDRVAQAFRDKRIRSPVHFPSDEQAPHLVNIFKDFREGDYVFSGWRSMWHALLAGIPEDELFQMILDGRSMFIQDKARRVFCSSIVGGILPIALGVAWSLKREKHELKPSANCLYCHGSGMEPLVYEKVPCHCLRGPRVFVLIGDMTRTTGLFSEFFRYAAGHKLPIEIFAEDNGLSTNTPTEEVWGKSPPWLCIQTYRYSRSHPHVGLQEKVSF